MKKLSIVLMAMVFAFGMAFTAQAKNLVEVKTTSEDLRLFPCEKSGSITFEFDDGSVLTSGDWWIIDLPFGLTLCSDIDTEVSLGCNMAILGTGNTTAFTRGPVTLDLGLNGTTGGVGTGIFFRVQGVDGSQRVTISILAHDNEAIASFVVPTGDDVEERGALTLKLFDSQTHAGYIWEKVPITGTCYIDPIEAIDNTMCIDARSMTGNTVDVSYNSGGAIVNFLTFTGDNEVAHRVSALDIQCVACKAGFTDDIDLTLGQGAACIFDYEANTGAYCGASMTPANPYKNRIIIQNMSGFFEDANYQVTLTITSPAAGVYWSGTGLAYHSNSASVDQTDCITTGTGPLGVWTAYKADGVTAVTTFDSGTCTVAAGSQANILLTTTSFTGINFSNQLWVNMPALVFDSAVVSAGDIVTIQVDLTKLPCTIIASCTVDIGTFVAACGAAPTGAYTFTLPYFPAINDAVWWSGGAFSNCLSADAGCTLTFNEKDGDIGTYDVTIAGGALWNTLWTSILSSITADAGNAGSLGDSAFFICISCTGGNAKALGMYGDALTGQSLGYVVGAGATTP